MAHMNKITRLNLLSCEKSQKLMKAILIWFLDFILVVKGLNQMLTYYFLILFS